MELEADELSRRVNEAYKDAHARSVAAMKQRMQALAQQVRQILSRAHARPTLAHALPRCRWACLGTLVRAQCRYPHTCQISMAMH